MTLLGILQNIKKQTMKKKWIGIWIKKSKTQRVWEWVRDRIGKWGKKEKNLSII